MTPSPDLPASRPGALATVALVLVIATAVWFLLHELSAVLRPLLMAVLLAYVLLPYHSRLQKRVSTPVSLVLLAGLTGAILVGVAFGVYAGVLGLSEELPALQRRAVGLVRGAESWIAANAPWLFGGGTGAEAVEEKLVAAAGQFAQPILAGAANVLIEAAVVGLYLLFLLLEGSRFPERVRRAYPPGRADEILRLAGQVNAAIVSYLKAKVKSSFFLAVPAGLVLWAFGVKFALLWAVLTFLCNFIPYVGSAIAFTLPAGFAFLQLDLDWRPVTVAVLLLGCQALSASVIEPMLLGRAVGLSPLVILLALAFWGLLWGLPGMFLAVPLTVVAVIVLDHFPFTRPAAKLLGGG